MRNASFITPRFGWLLVAASLVFGSVIGRAQMLSTTYNSPTQVPVTSGSYTAAGNTATFALAFAPTPGVTLTVISNTGTAFITGTFTNLAQGQAVPLTYNGVTYGFVANYFGGTGNDLVLDWADTSAFAWGDNSSGQLGDSGTANSLLPVAVDSSSDSALFGKTVVAASAGASFSLALASDGTVAAWGDNSSGQLGNSGTAASLVPVAVDATGVLATETVVSVSAGDDFALALCSDGSVVSWGDNASGQLGDGGAESSSNSPVAVDTSAGSALFGKTATAVSAGDNHGLALCSDGTVVAWGDNSSGELGDGGAEASSNMPVPVDTTGVLTGKTVIAVSAGNNFSLALCSDGTVVAWGDNNSGQLGDGGAETSSNVPVAVTGTSALSGKTVIAISAGDSFAIALCSDGTVASWGDNSSGQLGDSGTTSSNIPVAVSASGPLSGTKVVAVSAGNNFSLALCSSGAVASWGDNTSGALGDSGTTSSSVPVAVTTSTFPAGSSVVAVAAGPEAGSGLALVGEQTPPVIVVQQPAGTDLVSGVSSLDFGSVVLGTTNQLTFTVTNGGVAPLTNLALATTGSDASEFEPGALPSTTLASGGSMTFTVTFLPTAAGFQSSTLEVTSDDPVTPSFDIGLTGTGTALDTTFNSPTDVPVTSDGYTATGIAPTFTLNFAPTVGTNLTVVDNTSMAFISGTFGNLAQGQIVQLTYNGVIYNFVANYYGGTGNDLVLQWADTEALAWGDNIDGELGDGGTADSVAPVEVDSSTDSALFGKTITSLSAGAYDSLALCSDGSVAAWGNNTYGELGNSGTAGSLVPTLVETSTGSALSGKTVVAVSAGGYHNLALCSDGTVVAWGYGHDGELGDGSAANSSLIPVAVQTSSGLSGKSVVSISAGAFHSLALCSDGSLVAWGYNAFGALGNGGSNNSYTPAAVNISSGSALSGKTVVAVSAGCNHSLALCSDGSVAAWGENTFGELGNSGTANSLLPVLVDSSSGSALFGKTVIAVAAEGYHSLALCSDGSIAAWGSNITGELGDNSTANSLIPVAVDPSGVLAGKTVSALSGGLFDSLALCSDGSVAAWGWNYYGELGNGNPGYLFSAAPVAVDTSDFAAGDAFVALAAGPASYHSLGLVATSAAGQPLTFVVTPVAGTNGTISPNVAQTVASGSSVAFTATSGTGYVVNQWLVNGDVVQSVGAAYNLTDITANSTVQVTFAHLPAKPLAGAYVGIFGRDADHIAINLSANGKFSGTIIETASHAFSGQFNSAGAWQGSASGIAISLQLGTSGTSSPGSYFINGSANELPLTAWHTAYGTSNPIAETGTYTLQLTPAASGTGIPQVSGSATLTVSKTGAAQFSGKLPDGQPFNTATTIVGGPNGDQCIIYSPLAYKDVISPGARGLLSGAITFPSGDVTGPLNWSKPAQSGLPEGIDTQLILSP